MQKIIKTICFALILGPSASFADTIMVDKVRADAAIEVPTRGMSQKTVLNRFGEPKSRLSPVGDPPITRWVYSDYTVYFEYDHVIHSVVNR